MANVAGEAEIVLKANTANYSAGIEKAQRQLKALGATSAAAGHSTVAPWMASSAAIRVLEGNVTNNIRAAERFVATLPGVSRALQAAFPVIGAVALIGVLGKLGKEIYDVVDKAQKAPNKIQDGFRGMSLSIETQTESLRIHTLQTEDAINKLLGKPPVNGAAIALEETKKAAAELAQTLLEDQSRIDQLMKTDAIGFVQSLAGAAFTGKGQARTAGVEGSINAYSRQIADLAYQAKQATDAGNKALADSLNRQIQGKLGSFNQWTTSTLQDLRRKQAAGGRYDYSGAINEVEGSNLVINNRFANIQAKNADDVANQKKAQLEKQLAAAKEAASELMKQQRQALEKMEQGYESLGLKTPESAIVQFWANARNSFARGSDQYIEANREFLNALKEVQAQVHEQITKGMEKWNASTKADTGMLDEMQRGMDALEKDSAKQFIEQSKTNITPDVSKIEEAQLKVAELTGTISRNAAAEQAAAIHAGEYAAAIQNINFQLQNQNLSPEERDALKKQRTNLGMTYAAQSIEDNAAIDDSTLSGSVRNAMNLYVSEAQNAAAEISRILTGAFEGVNDSLSRSLMAHAYNGREYRRGIEQGLSNTSRGIGSQILNAGFKNVEGSVLGKFGFGPKSKPDGTASNPIYVRLANGQLAGGGSGLLASLTGGSSLQTSSEKGGSGITALIPTIASSLLHFADGGPIPSNMPSIVGERGPELFVPSSAGRIVPNHDLFGGNTHNWSVAVDARGATDPAAVAAAANRAVMAAAPHIIRAANSSQKERNLRTPASSRTR